jgi:hypothetical protein
VTARRVVNDRDMSRGIVEQSIDQVMADESGATGNENASL